MGELHASLDHSPLARSAGFSSPIANIESQGLDMAQLVLF